MGDGCGLPRLARGAECARPAAQHVAQYAVAEPRRVQSGARGGRVCVIVEKRNQTTQ